MPASSAQVDQVQGIANIGIATGVTAACGYRDDKHRVFCFNQDWQLDAAAQLELLALAQNPVTVKVGSHTAGDRIAAIMARRVDRLANASITEISDASCTGDCSRRVTVERAS